MIMKIVEFLRWPVTIGLLAGLLLLQLFPQMNPRIQSASSPSPPFVPTHAFEHEAPLSYAAAVRRASSAVVNIYTRTEIKRGQHRMSSHAYYKVQVESGCNPAVIGTAHRE